MFLSSRVRRLIPTLTLLAICLLATGCGKNKVSKANFDKITDGMSLAEVEGILGKGTKDEGDGSNVAGQFGVAVDGGGMPAGMEIYKWEKGTKEITVVFVKGKVQSKRPSGL